MTMFILQTLLLVAIAFILGCIVGCLLFRVFGGSATAAPKAESKPAPGKLAPAPEPEPARAPVAAAAGPKDDLKRIRGIGPQNETKLNAIGITTFAQIAALSSDEQRDIGERLAFPGRIEREEWVAQAVILEGGGETEFAKRVDKGEVETSQGTVAAAGHGRKPASLASAPAQGADDLTMIGGVGAALEKKLNALGIYTFAQIAEWSSDEQEWIGNELGFPGRPARENWSSEAANLAQGRGPDAPKPAAKGMITAKKK